MEFDSIAKAGRPPSNQPSPFQLISNSGYDQETMRNAEGAARAVVVSDWSKIPSEQYFEIEQASNLDILYVTSLETASCS